MNVAFIPVRGGSKSIPLKNIKEIAGKPLVFWVAKAANDAKCIDKVYVATDSEIIRQAVKAFSLPKVEAIDRSAESAKDTASTESVMLEFAGKYDFDNIFLIQATSPLLQNSDLENGYKLFASEGTDSVLSVVRQKRFHWAVDKYGYAHPTNYDVFRRPRRQEFEGYLVENGAFYITSKKKLLDTKNRISGNIKAYEMDEDTYFEIDEPSDWIIIEKILKNRKKSRIKMPEIKMFLTDCDGVLTDGGMYYSENGDELKKFNTKDGMGFRLLREKGIVTGIITGESRALNSRRAEKMQVDEIHQGVTDKIAVVRKLCQKYRVSCENVAYIGDDINDLSCMGMVGLSGCPLDAIDELKEVSGFVSTKKGGDGAVREFIEYIVHNTST